MNIKDLARNIVTAFAAQGTAFLCSAIMSLVVPKVLGVEEFGYWQLFIFYSGYMSFFQLGLNDGVYLQHGGADREKIDKSLIKSEYLIGLFYQALFAICFICFGLFFEADENSSFVLAACGFFLVVSNSVYYFGYVFQAMNETRKYSYSTMIDRISYLIPLVACLVLQVGDFRVYVLFFIVSRCLSFLYSFWNARDFLRSPILSLRDSISETIRSVKIGLILTFANISGQLIMGFARFAIDGIWGVAAFGKFSFSLSLVNFALTFISQAALVMFPALRQADPSRLKDYFVVIRDGLGFLLPFCYLLYLPMRILAGLWLPQYEDSLFYLIYLMPVCVYEVQTNFTTITFLRVRNQPKTILLINVIALASSLLLVLLGAFVIQSVDFIVLSAVFGIVIRYVLGYFYLSRTYGSMNNRLFLTGIILFFIFVSGGILCPDYLFFALCVVLLVLHGVINRREGRAVYGQILSISKRLRSK